MRTYKICKDVLNTAVIFKLKFKFYTDSNLTIPATQIIRNYTFNSGANTHLVPASNTSGEYILPTASTSFTIPSGQSCMEFEFQLCPDDTIEQPNEYFKIEIFDYVATDSVNYVANVTNTPAQFKYSNIIYNILDNDDVYVASFNNNAYNFTESLDNPQTSYLNTILINLTEGTNVDNGALSVRVPSSITPPVGYQLATAGVDYDLTIANPYQYTSTGSIAIPIVIYANSADQNNKYTELEIYNLVNTAEGTNTRIGIFITNTPPIPVTLYFDKTATSGAKLEVYSETQSETVRNFRVTRDNPSPTFTTFQLRFEFRANNSQLSTSVQSKRTYIVNDGLNNYTIPEGTVALTLAPIFSINNPTSSMDFTIRSTADSIFEDFDYFTVYIVNIDSSNDDKYPTTVISADVPAQFKYANIQYEVDEDDPAIVNVYFSKAINTPAAETTNETNFANNTITIARSETSGITSMNLVVTPRISDFTGSASTNRQYSFVYNSLTYTLNDGSSTPLSIPINMGVGVGSVVIDVNVPADTTPENSDYLQFQINSQSTTGSFTYITNVSATNASQGVYNDLKYTINDDDIIAYTVYFDTATANTNSFTFTETTGSTAQNFTLRRSSTLPTTTTITLTVQSLNSSFNTTQNATRNYVISDGSTSYVLQTGQSSVVPFNVILSGGAASKVLSIRSIDDSSQGTTDYVSVEINSVVTSETNFYTVSIEDTPTTRYSELHYTYTENDTAVAPATNERFGITSEISDNYPESYLVSSYNISLATDTGTAYTYETNTSNDQLVSAIKFPIPNPQNTKAGYGLVSSMSGTGDWFAMGRSGSGFTGEVYLFEKVDGFWKYNSVILGTGLSAQSNAFGTDVKLSKDGTTLVVGQANIFSNSNSGNVYVYTRTGSSWNLTATLAPNDVGAAVTEFGYRVDISDDNTMITTYTVNNNGAGATASVVYVYKYTSSWSQAQKVTLPAIMSGSLSSLSLAGNKTQLVVGYGSNGSNNGIAYVYSYNGTTFNTSPTTITQPSGGANNVFGQSVDMDDTGTRMIIGAPANGSATNIGHAYVYFNNAGTWVVEATMTDNVANTQFGYGSSINRDGSTIIVGAPTDGTTGAAFVYDRVGTTWTQRQKVLPYT